MGASLKTANYQFPVFAADDTASYLSDGFNKAMDEIDSEIYKREQAIDTLAQGLQETTTNLGQTNIRVQENMNDITELGEKTDTTNAAVSKLQSDLETTTAQVTENQQEIALHQTDIENIQTKNVEQDAELTSLAGGLTEAGKNIALLQNGLTATNLNVNQNRGLIDQQETKLEQTQGVGWTPAQTVMGNHQDIAATQGTGFNAGTMNNVALKNAIDETQGSPFVATTMSNQALSMRINAVQGPNFNPSTMSNSELKGDITMLNNRQISESGRNNATFIRINTIGRITFISVLTNSSDVANQVGMNINNFPLIKQTGTIAIYWTNHWTNIPTGDTLSSYNFQQWDEEGTADNIIWDNSDKIGTGTATYIIQSTSSANYFQVTTPVLFQPVIGTAHNQITVLVKLLKIRLQSDWSINSCWINFRGLFIAKIV